MARPHFTLGKDPVPILQEAGWTPGPVWTGGKPLPHRDSIPDSPARSQSLYRLGYPAHVQVKEFDSVFHANFRPYIQVYIDLLMFVGVCRWKVLRSLLISTRKPWILSEQTRVYRCFIRLHMTRDIHTDGFAIRWSTWNYCDFFT